MTNQKNEHPAPPKQKISLFGRYFHLPHSRTARIAIGVAFIFGGILGFLPILGFWMIPLGLMILSQDIPVVRRQRRRLSLWWGRRAAKRDQ